MFLPQNNSGHGNGSEMVSPFAELMKTFENARGNKSEAEGEAVQKQTSSRSIFNFLSRDNKSSKVIDAAV